MNEEQTKKLDEIHQALVGDEYRKGIINRLEKLENEGTWHKITIGLTALIATVSGFFINWK